MPNLKELVGQSELKGSLRPKIQVANAIRGVLPHLLFNGEKEVGKRKFASAVAEELGAQFTLVRAGDLLKPLDLTGIFANLVARQVLTITDIDLLGLELRDILVQAVSTFQVKLVIGGKTFSLPMPPFTFIGTTCKLELVDERLRRWCSTCQFVPYTREQATQIALQIGRDVGLTLDEAAASEIAAQCHLKPGEMFIFLQSVSSHVALSPADRISLGALHLINDFLAGVKPVDICNKCGERRELVLADCVCGPCNDALDMQWSHATANKWALVTQRAEGRGEYEPSVPTFIRIIEHMKSLEAADGRPTASTKSGVPARMFPPLHWLGFVSPDAEVLGSPGTLSRFIFGNVTYAEMKLHWAASNPPNELDMGTPPPEEIARISAGHLVPPFIRPATSEEITHYWASQRDRQRREEANRILERWGFDREGQPIPEFAKDDRLQERALRVWEEIKGEFREQGLLEGSLFDYEEEIRAAFPNDAGLVAAQAGVADGPNQTAISTASIRQPSRTESNPTRGFSQVAGMSELKEQLNLEVLGPLSDPELYRRYRVSLPNGILFYGPPGCGKTYIAKSLAEELGWYFQYVRPSEVASPYIHDTVNRIRALFSVAAEKAPSLIFIDEFEAFVPTRSELGGHQQYKAEEVNEFLANLEGCAEKRVLVIAATNEPEKIDPAVRRSGRFDKLILIPPPDAEARRAMLEFHLIDRPVESAIDTAGIAAILEGYSASDIKLLVDEGARMALKLGEPISTGTLLAVLDRVPPSITSDDMLRYSTFRSRGT